jgi:hypothetical protein
MTNQNSKIEEWVNEHPVFVKFYVPVVLTATFLVTVIDAINGSRGK